MKKKNQEKKTNYQNVNRDDLVDIADVKINTDLPVEDRIKDYIRQIKDPYCYICNGVVVRISFAGKCRLSDCLKTALFAGIE